MAVAEKYAKAAGVKLTRQAAYAVVDSLLAARIADAYTAMPHAPQDPVVRAAYQNLIRQTTAQYRALEAAGYKFWFLDMSRPDSQQYASTPWNAMRDIRANKQMGVFSTAAGFGSGDRTSENPLETTVTEFSWPTGSLTGPAQPVLANDLFRAVHDAFGHGLEGAGFRGHGEESAWQAHARLFTGSAVGAITSETRGQNSWLNYGPHGEANQTAKVEDTVFADQKTGLMPEWTWTEGVSLSGKQGAGAEGGTPGNAALSSKVDKQTAQTRTPEFKRWFGDWEAQRAQNRLDAMTPITIRSPAEWDGLPLDDLRDRVRASLEALADSGIPLRHPEIGDVSVTRNTGVKKPLSSSRDPAKLRVLGDLRQAFEGSIYASETPASSNDQPNVRAYEKLLARVVVGGQPMVAVFTVRKLTDGRQFYNAVTLEDAQRRTPAVSPRDTPIAGEHATSANTGVSSFVRQPLGRVNPDATSKVVDAKGRPLVVHHGAPDARFVQQDGTFKSTKERLGMAENDPDRAFFFAADRKTANTYADDRRAFDYQNAEPEVLSTYLALTNPLVIDHAGQHWHGTRDAVARAKAAGHDGVIINNVVDDYNTTTTSKPTTVYIAFDPTQIKSATGNSGAFDANDPSILRDLSRTGAQIARQGYERQDVPVVQAGRQIASLVARLESGKITSVYFEAAVRGLSEQMGQVSASKQANRLMADRARGADLVREKLIRGRRQGDLDPAMVDLALWVLDLNPALADNLGLSVRKGEGGVGGDYNPAAEIIRLFKGEGSPETATHEILHHTERMMPPEMQGAIRKEWAAALAAAIKRATPEQAKALQDIPLAMAGDKAAHQRLIDAIQGGVLNYAEHYQLINPSEYWAVNGARLLAARHAAKDSVWSRIANWTRELVQKVRGLLGLRSDAPIIKALNAVLAGDGSRQSPRMLSDMRAPGGVVQAISPFRKFGPDVPEETNVEAGRRVVQDRHIRMRTLREWAEANGVVQSDASNAYTAEERMHGRAASRIEDFRDLVVKPAVQGAQKAGFTMGQVAEYLHAKHAEERNVQIASINPLMPDGGSGMDTADARRILAAAPAGLARVAAPFQAITDSSRAVLQNGGIIDQATVNAWGAAYKNYVPLKGDDAADAGKTGSGQGLSVNGKQKRAMGHDARDESVVENILRDHERAVMLAEKNRVGQAMMLWINELQDPRIGTIDKPVKKAQLHNGTVRYVAPPMLAENEAQVYVNGQMVRMQLNDELLARSYKNLGADEMGRLVAVSREINTYLSKAYTGYNPAFIPRNLIRDFGSGLIKITGNFGAGMTAKTLAEYPKAMGTLLRYSLTGRATPEISAYRAHGGSTGAAYLGDLERIGTNIQHDYESYQGVMSQLRQGKKMAAARVAAGKLIGGLVGWIEHLNAAAENSMRLALFNAMRAEGHSVEAAASAAKNSTLNFNRKGEMGATLSAGYLFFNPSVQDTASVIETLTRGKHKGQAWALVAAMLAVSYTLAAMQFGGDDDDYEAWKKISDSTRDKNLIFRTGKDTYFAIPIPFGFGFAHSVANSLFMASKGESVGRLSIGVASNLLSHFSPVGNPLEGAKSWGKFDPTSLVQILPGMPGTGELGRAAVRVAVNRSSFGSEIVPDSKFDEERPDFLRKFRSTTGTVYDSAARGMSDLTGGSATQAGGIDMSPETLKFWLSTLTGGAGTFVADTARLVALGARYAVDPSDPAAADLAPGRSEIPILRDYFKKERVGDSRRAFWDAASDAKDAVLDFKRAAKAGDEAGLNRVLDDRAEIMALGKAAEGFGKMIKAQRDRVDEISADKSTTLAYKRAAIRVLEREEADLYDSYLQAVTGAEHTAAARKAASSR